MPLTEEERKQRRRESHRAWRERNREAINEAGRCKYRLKTDASRRGAVAAEMRIASVSVFTQPEPADLFLSLQRDLQLDRKIELQQALSRRARGIQRQDKLLECAMVPPAKDAAFMRGVRYE